MAPPSHLKFAIAPLAFSLLLISFLVLIDLTLGSWHRSSPDPTAPVLSLPLAAEASKQPAAKDFQKAIEQYKADRGAELKIDRPDKAKLIVFYFEWDRIEHGPIVTIAGHLPEECNVAAGFDFQGRLENRTYQRLGQDPLSYDATRFVAPSGQTVYVFKGAWIQGVGSWNLSDVYSRSQRLRGIFNKQVSAARILQAGVFGALNEEAAWQIFQSEVLDQLCWN